MFYGSTKMTKQEADKLALQLNSEAAEYGDQDFFEVEPTIGGYVVVNYEITDGEKKYIGTL